MLGKDLMLLSSSDNMIPGQRLFFRFSEFTFSCHTHEKQRHSWSVFIFKAIKQKKTDKKINFKRIRNKSLISAHFVLHFTTHFIFSFLFITCFSSLTGAICYTTHHFFIGKRSRVKQSSNLIMLWNTGPLQCEMNSNYFVQNFIDENNNKFWNISFNLVSEMLFTTRRFPSNIGFVAFVFVVVVVVFCYFNHTLHFPVLLSVLWSPVHITPEEFKTDRGFALKMHQTVFRPQYAVEILKQQQLPVLCDLCFVFKFLRFEEQFGKLRFHDGWVWKAK